VALYCEVHSAVNVAEEWLATYTDIEPKVVFPPKVILEIVGLKFELFAVFNEIVYSFFPIEVEPLKVSIANFADKLVEVLPSKGPKVLTAGVKVIKVEEALVFKV
jgi:hypothetical protein